MALFDGAIERLDGNGHAMGHCCLSLRLEVFAHLGQLYVEGLVMNGERTVHDEWFSMVENPQAPLFFARGESGASPEEFAASMRTFARRETFQ